MNPTRYTHWLSELTLRDLPKVGGKNAALGEMIGHLSAAGIRVPDGFAVTTDAYRAHLVRNDLHAPMRRALGSLAERESSHAECGRAVRALLEGAPPPDDVRAAIVEAYRELGRRVGRRDPAVAVRSSATAEDLPEASFAGQQETFLNVTGEEALVAAARRCIASLFTDRAISYRDAHGIDHMSVALSIGVQLMVRSDLGGSGVIFTLDTETGFPDVVMINAAWGLGENVVKGTVNPDEHLVWKHGLADPDKRPILGKRVGTKELTMVLAQEGEGALTKNIETLAPDRARLVLADDEALQLARWAVAIERHYSERAGKPVPMDVEWAKDGLTGELFIVQARPETVRSRERATAGFVSWTLEEKGTALVRGRAVGTGIASGPVAVVRDLGAAAGFVPGSILVAERTDPDWVPLMRQAAGIVTDHGGRTCHAAIVARELGLPAVVGAGDATTRLAGATTVTLSCASGDEGVVYAGALRFKRELVDVSDVPGTRTHIMMNLADPSAAFRWFRLPVDGIGLARMEFIISNDVRVHPMALVRPERVAEADRRAIAELCRGYADPSDYFVETLARGAARLAAAQWPKPVIVRMSDFKTNEYARLLGGAAFEPHEENPMIGFRGASRYADERYRDGFRLECRAMKRAREVLGLTNIVVMIPFCRTLDEADRVLAVMAEEGLARGQSGLEVYVMCEIPSNVVLASEFAERFDGFSIGSNDLTQLVLGVDRDNELLAATFDERNPAVVSMIREVIEKAQTAGRHIGICGQGPSDHPDFAALLVRAGIDAISLDPTTVIETRRRVAAIEAEAVGGSPGSRATA